MSFTQQVIDFNQQVLGIVPRDKNMLNIAEYDISHKSLLEEVEEFQEGHLNGDFIACVDSLIDLMYFANGVLYKMGLTAEEISKCKTAVHEANMEKKLGVNYKRGDGSAADAVKPEGWIAPEHRIIDILDGHA